MLTKTFHLPPQGARPARQQGMVLLIALIVLIAMTLAGVALMRSVDTTNIVAGNLAFQQAATHSADPGIEDAVTWLQTQNIGTGLDNDVPSRGYSANGNATTRNPSAGQTWDAFWTSVLSGSTYVFTTADSVSNKVEYVIDRMCNAAGSKTGGASCTASPIVSAATGNAEEGGEIQLNAPSVVYYRITVRVAGPRNTVSYVQAVVAL